MSVVTDFLMYTGPDDSGTEAFFDLIEDMRKGVRPVRIRDDDFPGPKFFEGNVFAASGNYWETTGMQAALDAVEWDSPEQVVVICCTEEGPARVYRPRVVGQSS